MDGVGQRRQAPRHRALRHRLPGPHQAAQVPAGGLDGGVDRAGPHVHLGGRGPGFRNVATHSVEPTATGSRATLSIDQHGVIGELFARLTADITCRYLDLEAAGLKRRSEESSQGA